MAGGIEVGTNTRRVGAVMYSVGSLRQVDSTAPLGLRWAAWGRLQEAERALLSNKHLAWVCCVFTRSFVSS